MPELGVYLVKPASRDAIAAALICSGVSKSGSPAPKLQTSIPSDFIALALLSIERVRDGVKLVALEESCIGTIFRTICASLGFQPMNLQAKCRRCHSYEPNTRARVAIWSFGPAWLPIFR